MYICINSEWCTSIHFYFYFGWKNVLPSMIRQGTLIITIQKKKKRESNQRVLMLRVDIASKTFFNSISLSLFPNATVEFFFSHIQVPPLSLSLISLSRLEEINFLTYPCSVPLFLSRSISCCFLSLKVLSFEIVFTPKKEKKND